MTEDVASIDGEERPVRYPRRLVIYALFNERGMVEDYVVAALASIRAHADRILVVVNGVITDEGRSRVDELADEVMVRVNEGFDIGAHRAALDRLGADVRSFDEVVFTNDTWFGPITAFDAVFSRMADQDIDFWGMTDHARTEPHPITKTGIAPYHLQSYWIAVRSRMLASPEWVQYWRDLPPLQSYDDAVVLHETRFTEYFATRGFRSAAAFPCTEFPTNNPSLLNADLLIEAGCPVLKRRVLFQWPPFMDRHAVVGRWALDAAASHGLDLTAVWTNLARTTEPKVLNTDAAMLEVLPDVDVSTRPQDEVRIAVVAHIFYEEMAAEILDRAAMLPGRVDAIVTTSDEIKAEVIRATLARGGWAFQRVEVRVVDSNDGRDQSAFLIGARDIVTSNDYDLIVKLHSKKTPQDGYAVGTHFRRQQFDNLLGSRGYAANLVALFQAEPGLGMVFPPTIHIGYPTLGHAWWDNRAGFAKWCAELGIRVPADSASPLAPFGSMFVARPEALRILTNRTWTYGDFGGDDTYRDGGLPHILERIPVYAAAELGFHVRTVLTADYAAISHTSLEFVYDQMAARVPGSIDEQIDLVLRAGHMGKARASDVLRMWLRLNHPGTGARLRRWLTPLLAIRRRLRGRPIRYSASTARSSWAARMSNECSARTRDPIALSTSEVGNDESRGARRMPSSSSTSR